MSATNIPSPCRITNIDLNDVMILPDDAKLRRMEFSEGQVQSVDRIDRNHFDLQEIAALRRRMFYLQTASA
jgi:hypothetical protein